MGLYGTSKTGHLGMILHWDIQSYYHSRYESSAHALVVNMPLVHSEEP